MSTSLIYPHLLWKLLALSDHFPKIQLKAHLSLSFQSCFQNCPGPVPWKAWDLLLWLYTNTWDGSFCNFFPSSPSKAEITPWSLHMFRCTNRSEKVTAHRCMLPVLQVAKKPTTEENGSLLRTVSLNISHFTTFSRIFAVVFPAITYIRNRPSLWVCQVDQEPQQNTSGSA